MEEQTILNIPMTPVVSNQVAEIGYDTGTSTLRLRFKNKAGLSAPYDYPGVPAEVHAEFLKAESKGKFFGANIKGKFDFLKLPMPAEPAGVDLDSDKPLTGGAACTGETCESCQ